MSTPLLLSPLSMYTQSPLPYRNEFIPVDKPVPAFDATKTLVSPPLEHESGKPLEAIRLETYFGFVNDTVSAYFLIEACVAGTLPCVRDTNFLEPILPPRSGTVIVFAEQDGKKLRWNDGKHWSVPTKEKDSSFVLSRETEQHGLRSRHTNQRERSSLFRAARLKPSTQLIPNGLARRTISMNGSDNKRYRVVSYFYPCHVQHFYTKAGGSGPLQIPSQQPKFTKFMKEWMAYNHAKKQQQKMDAELTLLPESIVPIDQPVSRVVQDWNEQQERLLAPLTLPPSILPFKQPKVAAVKKLVLQSREALAVESLLNLAQPA
ncbi:hypothetical protein HDU98_000565 [Podochytrium sp. JEL0797]|nr:hypothetical protein HDU98_000565 [Podochytrium sp. JEL0797]